MEDFLFKDFLMLNKLNKFKLLNRLIKCLMYNSIKTMIVTQLNIWVS
jgi:hypothetical protein